MSMFSNKIKLLKLCSSRKYPYYRRGWNFLGGVGFCKTKKFKEMYEAYMVFRRGGEVLEKNPFHGGGGKDIFWNYTFQNNFVTVCHNAKFSS